MRISDWSSDVCSSDLQAVDRGHQLALVLDRAMRPDENGDDHCARRVALHAHEGGMEEKFIRSVLAQDHEPVALGDTQPLEERLVERIGECALLCARRSEEHTSELQSLMRISYADFCLKKKKH